MIIRPIDSTSELVLWEARHAEALFAAVEANREHLRQWLPWVDATKEVEDTRKFIKRALDQFAANNGFHGGIFVEGQIVGGFGMHYIHWTSRKTEIGYWLAKGHEGRGLATRACSALIDYLFDDLKLNRVEIQCATENTRSRAIPRRLGFREEGTLREVGVLHGGHVDHVIYSLLAREWKI